MPSNIKNYENFQKLKIAFENLNRVRDIIINKNDDLKKADSILNDTMEVLENIRNITTESLSLESHVINKYNVITEDLKNELFKVMKDNELDPELLYNNVSREDVLDTLGEMYNNYVSKAKNQIEDFFGNMTARIGRGLYYPVLMAKRLLNGKDEYNFTLLSRYVLTMDLLKKMDLIANSPLWTPNIDRDIKLIESLPKQYGSFECNLSIEDMNKLRAEFDAYSNNLSITDFFGVHIKKCNDKNGFSWDIEANRDVGKATNVLVTLINSVDPTMAIGVELKFLHNGNTIEKFNTNTFKKMLKEKIKHGIEDENHDNNNDEYKNTLIKLLGSITAHKLRVYKLIKEIGIQSIRHENKQNENETKDQIHDSKNEEVSYEQS